MLRYLDRWEVTLGPGELLFVPAGAAHAVTNLSLTLCVTLSLTLFLTLTLTLALALLLTLTLT